MITGMVVNAIMCTETIIIGNLYQFDVFRKTPPYIFFGYMFLNGQAYITLAIMYSTLVKTKNHAFTINFVVILVSMVMNIVLAEPTMIKKVFYNLDMPSWITIGIRSFYFIPAFQFGKMFMDLTTITCFHFDPEHLYWVKSERDFEWDDLFNRNKGVFFSLDRYEVDSMWETAQTLIYLIMWYGFLAWYFDNTLPDNRGVPKEWNFFLKPSFWFPTLFVSETAS